jgi:hypothetical protein
MFWLREFHAALPLTHCRCRLCLGACSLLELVLRPAMVVIGDGTSRRILGPHHVPLRCSTVHRIVARDLLIA